MSTEKTLFVSSLTSNSSVALDNLGDVRYEGGKVYKYIQFDNGAGNVAAVAGNLANYVVETGLTNNKVTSDTSVGGVPAGIFMAALTDQYYGWIQVKGPATINTAIETSNDGTPVAAADGDALVQGDADGAFRRQNTVIDADAEALPAIAIAVDASAKIVILDFFF